MGMIVEPDAMMSIMKAWKFKKYSFPVGKNVLYFFRRLIFTDNRQTAAAARLCRIPRRMSIDVSDNLSLLMKS